MVPTFLEKVIFDFKKRPRVGELDFKIWLSGFRFAYLPVPGEEDLMC